MSLTLAVVALVVAVIALVLVRRQSQKLAHLTEMYWQLKYDHGELKATVAPPPEPEAPSPPPATFVPLTAVKRTRP